MTTREEYRQKMQAQLDEWKAELDKLQARAEGAQADARAHMKKNIDALNEQMAEGRRKLAELGEAGDDAWEAMKGRMNTVWDSMKSAFNEATRRFRE